VHHGTLSTLLRTLISRGELETRRYLAAGSDTRSRRALRGKTDKP
jgi:hypothetical protein